MTDIRCPMCGKLNPPNAQTCSFCKARLKPVKSSSEDETKIPDWLSGLSAAGNSKDLSPEENQNPSSENEPEKEDEPDWLSRIRGSIQTEKSSPDQEEDETSLTSSPSEEVPDWIKEIRPATSRLTSKGVPSKSIPAPSEEPPEDETLIGKPAASETSGEEDDDWLRRFASLTSSHEEPPKTTAPSSDIRMETNGWEHAPDETPKPESGVKKSEEEIPDWLKGLEEFQPDEPSAKTPVTPTENTFREEAQLSEEPAAINASPFQSQPDQNDTPEWSPEAKLEEPAKEEPAGNPEELPDWLRIPDASSKTSDTEESPFVGIEDEVPDWLHPGAEITLPGGGDPVSLPNSEEEIPDWLSASQKKEDSVPEEPGALPASEEDLPDWLRAHQEMSATVTPESAEAPTSNEEIPDWFNTSQVKELPVIEEPAVLPASEEDLPDWLRAHQEMTSPAAPEVAQSPVISEDIPGWMQIQKEALEPTASESPVLPGSEEEIPDWLGISQNLPTPLENEEQIPLKGIEEKALNWLREIPPDGQPTAQAETEFPGLSSDEPVEKPVVDQRSEKEEWEIPAWLTVEQEPAQTLTPAVPAQTDEIPDWLQEVRGAIPESMETKDETGAVPSPVSPFQVEELPDWMNETGEIPVKEEGTKAPPSPFIGEIDSRDELHRAPLTTKIDPFAGEDMRSWMGDDAIQPAKEPAKPDELELTQLPGWVEAMRPVEALAMEKSDNAEDNKVESSGPLAGLRAVLHPEEAVIQYRKPPVYSFKLQVTEKQRVQASMLETLLEETAKTKDETRQKRSVSQKILRTAIGLILVISVTFAMLAGSPSLANGVNIPPELQSFNEEISSLPQGAPVLIGVEYEAGFQGEMRFAAAGVLQQLMLKQARLVVVSTIPEGAILGEDLRQAALDRFTNSGIPVPDSQVNGEFFLNLGYLPGGTASLSEFALLPRQAAFFSLNTPLDGHLPWNSPLVTNINKVSDFAMVILVTDRIENGRAWLEQVQPNMGTTPLLVISSAQTAPLLQTYLQTGQIQGMLTGLLGGLTYDSLGQKTGDWPGLWNAYQVGVAFIIIIILLGAIYQGINSLLSSIKKEA
jgi:hypothetical protein